MAMPVREEIPESDEDRRERLRCAELAARFRRWDGIAGKLGRRYGDCSLDGKGLTLGVRFECSNAAQRAALDMLLQFEAELPAHVKAGRGLILFGPVGTGKDHLLAAMLRSAVLRHGLSVEWLNGLDLYGLIRDRMDTGAPSTWERCERSEEDLVRSLAQPMILAISDPLPPAGDASPFNLQMLLRVIDRRYRHMLPTWLTLNAANGQDAEERLSAPIVDRLRHGALGVYCNWPSYRTAMPPLRIAGANGA